MTQITCPSCRLRFVRDPAVHLDACPRCAEPLVRTSSARAALGYPLFDDASAAEVSPARTGYAALVAALQERS
jgi:hypothetical protein